MWPNGRIRFLVTGACNATCPHCHNEGVSKKARFLPVQMVRLLADVARTTGELPANGTLSGGEPLLHPQLLNILHELSEVTESITIPTNGFLLDRRMGTGLAQGGVTKLRIDLDPWRFDRPRDDAGNLNTARVSELVKMSRDLGMDVALNTVLTAYTSDQLIEFLHLCAELQIDIKCFERVLRESNKFVSTPDVPFEVLDSALHRTFGKVDWFIEPLGNGDRTTRLPKFTLRFCRPLCGGQACVYSGLRCDPGGHLSTCINGFHHARLLEHDTVEEAAAKIDATKRRGCCT